MGRRSRAASGVGIALALGLLLFWAFRDVSFAEKLTALQGRVEAMGPWALALYPLLMAACNVLLLPGGVLIAGAGLLFGLWWGALVVQTGNLLGAAAAFFISRRFGRGWLEQKLRRSARLAAFDEAIAREGWRVVFFSQLHPAAPSSLLNYLYGVTRLRFWPCMFWILAGQLPGVFLYTYLGTLAQLGLKVANGENHPRPGDYWIWLGGLAATGAITLVLGRIALRALRNNGHTGRAGDAGGQPF